MFHVLLPHLWVDDDLHVHCILFLQPLDGRQRDPKVVGVEDLKLGNRLEFVHMRFGNLGDL